MPLFTVLRRALVTNLGKVSATGGEQARLEAAGICEPTIQHYLVWRRSMLAVIVLVTIVSAALTTYHALTRSDERSLFSAMAERFVASANEPASTTGKSAQRLVEDAKKSLSAVAESEDPEEAEEAKEELVAKGKAILEDAKKIVSASGESGLSDRKAEIDKAVLKKAVAEVAGDVAESDEENEEKISAFGMFADAIHLASLFAVPLASLAALWWWTRFRRTFRILAVGWAFSFFIPMLIALCPWTWWGYVEPGVSPGKQGPQYYRSLIEGVLEGADYLIALLPTVLSLIPGVQRACLRVKTLLPEAMLPGWFLVAAGPLYALFLLVAFVAISQVATTAVFYLGMSLLVAAPLVYVVRADVVTRPLVGEEECRRMRRMQRIASSMTLLACVILIIYATTRQLFGVHLVGLNPETSLLRPMDLVEYAMEFVGRLLFMTVLGADLFMRMNLVAWNHFRIFLQSGKEADYDRVMQAMEEVS